MGIGNWKDITRQAGVVILGVTVHIGVVIAGVVVIIAVVVWYIADYTLSPDSVTLSGATLIPLGQTGNYSVTVRFASPNTVLNTVLEIKLMEDDFMIGNVGDHQRSSYRLTDRNKVEVQRMLINGQPVGQTVFELQCLPGCCNPACFVNSYHTQCGLSARHGKGVNGRFYSGCRVVDCLDDRVAFPDLLQKTLNEHTLAHSRIAVDEDALGVARGDGRVGLGQAFQMSFVSHQFGCGRRALGRPQ